MSEALIENTAIQYNGLICPSCQCDYVMYEKTPRLQHIGKFSCANCGAFIQWLKKEKQKPRKMTYLRPDVDYCEICLKKKSALPDGIVLHEHHILEYQHHPELDNDPENRLVVCSNCHKIIHAIRNMMKECQ